MQKSKYMLTTLIMTVLVVGSLVSCQSDSTSEEEVSGRPNKIVEKVKENKANQGGGEEESTDPKNDMNAEQGSTEEVNLEEDSQEKLSIGEKGFGITYIDMDETKGCSIECTGGAHAGGTVVIMGEDCSEELVNSVCGM